jgi:hypothetical protein
MAQYLVMKRASIELNFHILYSNFLDVLKIPEFNQMVLRETFRNIKVRWSAYLETKFPHYSSDGLIVQFKYCCTVHRSQVDPHKNASLTSVQGSASGRNFHYYPMWKQTLLKERNEQGCYNVYN